jgi:hypothetical protein
MCMSVFLFLLTKVQPFSHTAKFLAGKDISYKDKYDDSG